MSETPIYHYPRTLKQTLLHLTRRLEGQIFLKSWWRSSEVEPKHNPGPHTKPYTKHGNLNTTAWPTSEPLLKVKLLVSLL